MPFRAVPRPDPAFSLRRRSLPRKLFLRESRSLNSAFLFLQLELLQQIADISSFLFTLFPDQNTSSIPPCPPRPLLPPPTGTFPRTLHSNGPVKIATCLSVCLSITYRLPAGASSNPPDPAYSRSTLPTEIGPSLPIAHTALVDGKVCPCFLALLLRPSRSQLRSLLRP